MYKVGMITGKFLPPHRGHIIQIINSATQCEKLYVLISDNKAQTERLCKESNLPVMDLLTRTKWLSQELQGFDHIKVVMIDESNIPEYPDGWVEWTALAKKAIPEKIDVIFGGEQDYTKGFAQFFPETEYKLYDYERTQYSISGTLVRQNPFKYWDYILGSARPFFAKKILLTGTESCGKTTLTKYLGKIFHTSWSEEAGRFYANKFLGDNEDVYTLKDFQRITYMQYEADMDALRKANKVVFYDTDALVTLYYLNLYLNIPNDPLIEGFVDPSRYDAVLLCTPSVKWVDDGMRFMGKQNRREELHKELEKMYFERGFENKMYMIDGDYNQRLNKAIEITNELIFKQISIEKKEFRFFSSGLKKTK